MFTTKTESSNCCATSATIPRATMIETIAINSGMSPATTAPKTSRRMTSAAGRPNWSSPFSRSSCDSRLKSWSSVRSPAIEISKAGSSSARSTSSITASVSPSSSIATEMSVAWRSAEIAALGSVRYERPCFRAGAVLESSTRWTKASNSGVSTVYRSERTTTTSVTSVSRSRGKARASTSTARSDSGLFVGAPSVVRLPPSRTPIAAMAAKEAASHAPIARHGCRALTVAMVCVESFMEAASLPIRFLSRFQLRHELLLGLGHRSRDRPPLARDEQGDDGADPNRHSSDPERRNEPVTEGRRRLVTTRPGEDRRQNRDPEDTTDLTDCVVRAGRLALFLRPHRREHDVGDRGEEHRHSDARQDERPDQTRVADGRRRDCRDPRQTDRLQREPRRHDRPPADPVGEGPCDGGD